MMKFIDKFNTIIHKPFFSKYSTVMGLWALLGVIAWITKYFPGKYNNFSIFRQSFWHTLNELPLYAAYPEEYNDIFHYGPVFSLVIAPFAITPLWLGLLTWSVAQSLFLFWAVNDATGDQAGTYLYLLVLRPRVAYLAFHVAIQYQYRRYHCPRLRIDRERERRMGRFRDHVGYL